MVDDFGRPCTVYIEPSQIVEEVEFTINFDSIIYSTPFSGHFGSSNVPNMNPSTGRNLPKKGSSKRVIVEDFAQMIMGYQNMISSVCTLRRQGNRCMP